MAEETITGGESGTAEENALGFGGERDRGARASDPSGNATIGLEPAGGGTDNEYRRRRSLDAGDLPEGMDARYLVERRRLLGEQRYYENASDAKPAFRDKGNRLVADNNSRDLIRDMVDIAEHRGWDRISVSGSEEFRREVWREAALRGLDVDGYRPKPRELQEIGRTRDQQEARANTVTPGDRGRGPGARQRNENDSAQSAGDVHRGTGKPGAPARADFDRGVSGRLIDVGEAHYGGKPGAKITPYADIVLDDGRQERAWGVGLPAALRETGAGVGDLVVLRRLGTERVEVTIGVLNPGTGERSSEVREVNRNRWSAERLLAPDIKGARQSPDATDERQPRDAAIDAGRSTSDNSTDQRTRTRRPGGDDGPVERAYNAGDDLLGVRTAPTHDSVERDPPTSGSPNATARSAPERDESGRVVPRKDDDVIVPDALTRDTDRQDERLAVARDTASRGSPGGPGLIGDRDEGGASARSRNSVAERGQIDRIAHERETDGGGGDLRDNARNRLLADRFRTASSAEAARDPDLRAAQSQFVAAKAIVTSTLGHEPAAAQRLIAQSRETLARALEQGKSIPAAELRGGREVRSDRSPPQPERTRGGEAEASVTKTPARSRGR